MKQQAQSGFSLLELMTVIAVLAIVASLAVPPMRAAAADMQVRQAAGCLSNSLSNVRSLAMSSTQSAYLRPVANGTDVNVWNNVANDSATVTVANADSKLSAADKTKLAENGASWYVSTGTDSAETLREFCIINDDVRVFAVSVPGSLATLSLAAPKVISYDFTGRRTSGADEVLYAVCSQGANKLFRLTVTSAIGSSASTTFTLQQVKDSNAGSNPDLALINTVIGTDCDA